MLDVIDKLFEVSVLSLAFSFLLIYRVFEASCHEAALVSKRDCTFALIYFICLFSTVIISLSIIILSELVYHEDIPKYLNVLSYLPIISFVIAQAILLKLVILMYSVIPYLPDCKKEKTKEAEEYERLSES